MTCEFCKRLRSRLWVRWTKMTGAYQARAKSREDAWIDRRDLCQNLNQLESQFTDYRRDVKQRHIELDAAINRGRERVMELAESKISAHRDTLADMRQKNGKLLDEIAAINDEIELIQNRLDALERPSPEKIGS